jgi:hypothetical protein
MTAAGMEIRPATGQAPDQRFEVAEAVAGTCMRAGSDRLTSPEWVRRFLRLARRPPAQVAELVDALVSGTSGAIRGGSSPLLGTISGKKTEKTAFFRRLANRWTTPPPIRRNAASTRDDSKVSQLTSVYAEWE